ncbi:MAG: hypothetical protein HQK98_07435 [Nitrospirae bacterium]|nr:hypothetical protein [Nitrospirota bacterium]
MLKATFRILLKLILLAMMFGLLMAETCKDDVVEEYLINVSTGRYFEGTGHSEEVILDGSDYKFYRLKLDNFTKDAYDILVSSLVIGSGQPYWDTPHYWLRFSYETFSTYCTEVDKSKTVMPYILLSPDWWPWELGKHFIPTMRSINRSNFKFYRCSISRYRKGYSYFEYFAIDNKTKTGYYWRTTRGAID